MAHIAGANLFKFISIQSSFKILLATSSSHNGPGHSHRRSDFVRPNTVCESAAAREHWWGGAQNVRSAKHRGRRGGGPVAAGKGGVASCGAAGWWGWLGDATKPEQGYTRGHTHKFQQNSTLPQLLEELKLKRCRSANMDAQHKHNRNTACLHTNTALITCFGHTSGVPSVSLPPMWQSLSFSGGNNRGETGTEGNFGRECALVLSRCIWTKRTCCWAAQGRYQLETDEQMKTTITSCHYEHSVSAHLVHVVRINE